MSVGFKTLYCFTEGMWASADKVSRTSHLWYQGKTWNCEWTQLFCWFETFMCPVPQTG